MLNRTSMFMTRERKHKIQYSKYYNFKTLTPYLQAWYTVNIGTGLWEVGVTLLLKIQSEQIAHKIASK